MQSLGNVQSIQREFMSDKVLITVKLDKVSIEELQKFNSEERYQITIEKPKKKRSLSANAYFHVLIGKIAEALIISKAYAKNIMICKYGQPELFGNEPLIYKTNAPWEYMREQEFIHANPVRYSEENGKQIVFYKIFRGSSTYNQEEMRLLIEGTVADARDLGIDTESKTSINKMLEEWGKVYAKKSEIGSSR